MTEPKADAWMPLWIGAYMADTMTFTTQQHGAYLLLLMAYWRERTSLRDDDDELRSITKSSAAEWAKLRPVLARKFRVADGVWCHKRVEAEIADAKRRIASAQSRAQAGGKAAAEKRRKQSSDTASGTASGTVQAVLEQCSTPSPSAAQSSEPIGSAVPAVDNSNAKAPEAMTKAELWAAGKSLMREAGVPEAQCGPFVGALIGDYTDTVVIDAVRAALVATPADPKSYLVATCKRLVGERGVKSLTVPGEPADAYVARIAAERAADVAHMAGSKGPPPQLLALARKAPKEAAA
jgi:uncharacterized protein YdaU (DUF1376 family)